MGSSEAWQCWGIRDGDGVHRNAHQLHLANPSVQSLVPFPSHTEAGRNCISISYSSQSWGYPGAIAMRVGWKENGSNSRQRICTRFCIVLLSGRRRWPNQRSFQSDCNSEGRTKERCDQGSRGRCALIQRVCTYDREAEILVAHFGMRAILDAVE